MSTRTNGTSKYAPRMVQTPQTQLTIQNTNRPGTVARAEREGRDRSATVACPVKSRAQKSRPWAGSVRVACGGSHHAAGEAVTEHASKQQDEFAQAVLSGGTATLRNGLSAGEQIK